MADVIGQIKKHGSYSTKTEDEGKQADDLLEDGLVTISDGGSITEDEQTVTIRNCLPTKKFKDLVKKGII
ncbi:hypothetical protein [uncultured Kosakonia sp.]|uniref:hypothetical protein n=1 Tax=uncultured Kosakonia sp. TaxID=1588927 RepID=UPI002591A27C|nr:hypothetical protein [uncultured Kosakonia sp.]